jgi:hypothetical protein
LDFTFGDEEEDDPNASMNRTNRYKVDQNIWLQWGPGPIKYPSVFRWHEHTVGIPTCPLFEWLILPSTGHLITRHFKNGTNLSSFQMVLYERNYLCTVSIRIPNRRRYSNSILCQSRPFDIRTIWKPDIRVRLLA